MRVLITGINGMVASHLAELCLEKGDEVWGTYRWQEDDSNIKHLIGIEDFHLLPLNINDYGNFISVIQESMPNAISHLACESYVKDSFDHPEETIRTGGLGTLNLLRAVEFMKGIFFDPVIHICSSSEVYGLVTEDLVPIKETCRFNPCNPYAVGKVTTDMLGLMYYTNYGLQIIRTRMFTHFSYRRKMLSAEVNFANQIAKIEKESENNFLHNDGAGLPPTNTILKHGNLNSVRTFADARDAVKAYYLILSQPKKFGEVYNIGGETSKKIGEMLDYMISLSPMKKFIIKEQDPNLMRHHDVTLQIPDVSKFKKDYPEWKPEISFEQSIQDLLNEKRRKVGLEK